MTLPVRTLAVAATAFAHVPPVVFGLLTPGYSAVAHYISELGAVGAPYAAAVNLGTFLPAGVLLVLTCVALTGKMPPTRAARAALMLIALIGVSWIVAAFAPCDAGCPVEGSPRQAVHNLAGFVGYVGGGIGLLTLAGVLRSAGAAPVRVAYTAACGVLLVAGLQVMSTPEFTPIRGAIQRAMELGASAWMLASAWQPAVRRSRA